MSNKIYDEMKSAQVIEYMKKLDKIQDRGLFAAKGSIEDIVAKAQAIKDEDNQAPGKTNAWSGNVYTYHFTT